MKFIAECSHCKTSGTSTTHLDKKISKFSDFVFAPVRFFVNALPGSGDFLNKLEYKFVEALIISLDNIGILKPKPIEGGWRRNFRNRTLVFVDHAKRKGFSIKNLSLFGNPTSFFTLKIHGKKYYFSSLPLAFSSSPKVNFDDKKEFKDFLSENNFPTPEGESFRNKKKAKKFASSLKSSIVVKPRSSSLGRHVSVDIQGGSDFEEAFKIAKQIDSHALVEEHVDGKLFRATVVGESIAAVCRKEPPNVVGDGVSSIKELINQKNQEESRAPKNKKNATLYELPTNVGVEKFLSENNFSLDYVPSEDEKVYLHWKEALSFGADIHDVTDLLHHDNESVLESLAESLGVDLVGIDIIAKDISKSWEENNFYIIEANSLPYIDMHHFPSSGKLRNVAQEITSHLFDKINTSNKKIL